MCIRGVRSICPRRDDIGLGNWGGGGGGGGGGEEEELCGKLVRMRTQCTLHTNHRH